MQKGFLIIIFWLDFITSDWIWASRSILAAILLCLFYPQCLGKRLVQSRYPVNGHEMGRNGGPGFCRKISSLSEQSPPHPSKHSPGQMPRSPWRQSAPWTPQLWSRARPAWEPGGKPDGQDLNPLGTFRRLECPGSKARDYWGSQVHIPDCSRSIN